MVAQMSKVQAIQTAREVTVRDPRARQQNIIDINCTIMGNYPLITGIAIRVSSFVAVILHEFLF